MDYRKRQMGEAISSKNKTIFLVCGSVRPGSLTRSAVNLLESYFQSKGFKTDLFHPENLDISYLGASFPTDIQNNLKQRILDSAGVVFCTPEYNGCFSSVTMAILENLGYPSVLKHKPISLLGVAAGTIGAVKALEHLRGVCSHMGGIVLPWSVSIATVHKQFDEDRNCIDQKTSDLIHSLADEMIVYLTSVTGS